MCWGKIVSHIQYHWWKIDAVMLSQSQNKDKGTLYSNIADILFILIFILRIYIISVWNNIDTVRRDEKCQSVLDGQEFTKGLCVMLLIYRILGLHVAAVFNLHDFRFSHCKHKIHVMPLSNLQYSVTQYSPVLVKAAIPPQTLFTLWEQMGIMGIEVERIEKEVGGREELEEGEDERGRRSRPPCFN